MDDLQNGLRLEAVTGGLSSYVSYAWVWLISVEYGPP